MVKREVNQVSCEVNKMSNEAIHKNLPHLDLDTFGRSIVCALNCLVCLLADSQNTIVVECRQKMV